MPSPNADEQDPTLPPPGQRWGSGAQSVLPYLTKSLQSKPAAQETRDSRSHDEEPQRPYAGWNRPAA
ncbi:MAG TPA: hypothetical protein VF522_00100 [Ramlibacter sp.]|uniref:hypothetical protein n=1 Tax=Ramlibacter sp. TaxID=1917967 RepID=UPI002ED603D9